MSNKEKYLKLAATHSRNEIANILGVKPETVRKYAQHTGVRCKTEHIQRRTLSEWSTLFKETFSGELSVSNLRYNKQYKPIGDMICMKCNHSWTGQISSKIRNKSLCTKCSKAPKPQMFTHSDVEAMLDSQEDGRWELIKYGKYSQKDSVIQCQICEKEHLVNLNDFINTTSMRCTHCQTGSFGEFVIATTLSYNHIPFVREFPVKMASSTYRIDFMISDDIALEYHGMQHVEKGTMMYSEKVNSNVEKKRLWCQERGILYIEMSYQRLLKDIVIHLSDSLGIALDIPPPKYFSHYNSNMEDVLEYMRYNSARKTMKYFGIPVTRIKKYVKLQGFDSISAWQKENKII